MAVSSIFQPKLNDGHVDLTRPVFAIILMIIVLMGLGIATLWWTAEETNRIDSERTALALVNAVAGEASELQAMAEDNGNWDDSAAAIHELQDLAWFMETGYADISKIGTLYDGVAVVDLSGRLIAATRRGQPSDSDPLDWIGAELPQLLARAEAQGGAAGLISGSDGVRLAAASIVLPTSEARLAAHRRAGYPSRFIIFTRTLDAQDIAAIGQSQVISGLSLAPIQHNAGSASNGDPASVATLRDVRGHAIATLRWEANAPANRAIVRSLPFMAAALLVAFMASALLLQRSYAAIAHINRIASLDSLSDLPNRRTLRHLMRRALKQEQEVALAFIDLDGFKAINDLYGHGIGDALIVECANFIQSIAPKRGGAARLGGDEFALFAYGAAANTRLEGICERLLGRLREPFHIGDRTISIGASIGLADRRTANSHVNELMREADVAMYVAKRSGKMRLAWFSHSHDEERSEALEIETRLRSALERNEFRMVYQPLVKAKDGQTVGFEALLRWDCGATPPIGPDRFIPIAEDTGLIDRIGRFALRTACTDAKDWPDLLTLSVNISAAQLRNPHFPEIVSSVLVETGVPAHRLMLEITETCIVNDPALARRVLTALRALGVRVALDDFGSGFASIGFLRQFTFDTLKIDRTLVIEAIGDKAASAMLHSSVAVARALGIQTVAEGIETEAQALMMRAAGCDILQGWHFGREQSSDMLGVDTEAKSSHGRRKSA